MQPCPAIRFKEVDEEIGKLRVKEKGDWKQLTLEEKKTCKYYNTVSQKYQKYSSTYNSRIEKKNCLV
jgi:hypothetical protein